MTSFSRHGWVGTRPRAIWALGLLLGPVACQDARVDRPNPSADPPVSPERPADPNAAEPRDAGGWDLAVPQGVDAGRPPDARSACPGGVSPPPRPCAEIGVTVDPAYADRYTCFDLGPVPGVPPTKYGGLTLTQEKCSTTLLIGGEANLAAGKIYAVPVLRDQTGHISGFGGTAQVFADAPYNDGGLVFTSQGVLLATRWPSNEIQMTRPGAATVDKVIDLAPLGVAFASASLNFVPATLPAAGALKLVSWSQGSWYTVTLQPDGQGLFDIPTVMFSLNLPGGPEGFVYVAKGSPLFDVDSLLVSEWTANRISTYTIDDEADPVLGSRRDFVVGLDGAEGAYRDPATGDFFFSTWGQMADRVIVVRGFAPIPVID